MWPQAAGNSVKRMPSTLLRAVISRRFLLSPWPWRGLAYAITTGISSAALWLLLLCPISLGYAAAKANVSLAVAAVLAMSAAAIVVFLGPPLAVVFGYGERWRLRLADDRPAVANRIGTLYLDPNTWRAFAYLLALAILPPVWLGGLGFFGLLIFGLIAAPFAVPLSSGPIVFGPIEIDSPGPAAALAVVGVLLIPVLLYAASAFSGVQAALARLLLCPDPALAEVSQSRTRLADAFDAERHRIERDLHDVAQQRLVNLTMQLSLAKLDVPPDSPGHTALEAAHEQAKILMAELRDLIRGINPRTLKELGLRAALEELADDSTLTVALDVNVGRLPAAVETVAYFAVSEALTNVAKHSGTTQASVTVRQTPGMLHVEVHDEGRGGANPTQGSGITGLADRIAAAGGRLLLSSPQNGPTVVRIELPCAS